MGVLLPAAIGAGILLLKRHPMGYLLAPTVLGTLILLSIGIVAAMVVLAGRGLEAPACVAISVGFLTLVEAVTMARFLLGIDAAAGPPFRRSIPRSPVLSLPGTPREPVASLAKRTLGRAATVRGLT